jgi:hypothetical protein
MARVVQLHAGSSSSNRVAGHAVAPQQAWQQLLLL